jgi:predicted TIM-barrel enzyme
VIYNSGRYRMAGRGSLAGLLAYGNANEIVCEMAHEVLPVVKHTPVLAGVNGTDPFMIATSSCAPRRPGLFRHPEFPDGGPDRRHLPRQPGRDRHGLRPGSGTGGARPGLDLLTTPYVFSEANAREMAAAGADIVVCHLGLTTGGNIGASTALTLADCVDPIDAWSAAARAVNPDVLVLCHGGPIATVQDATWILSRCAGCHGFYGASSMERLPTESHDRQPRGSSCR